MFLPQSLGGGGGGGGGITKVFIESVVGGGITKVFIER